MLVRGLEGQHVQLVGAPRDDRQPDHGGPARAEAVVHAAGDRHAHRHDQRLRQQEQAGLEGAEALGLLQVERDVEQHGEQADRQHRDEQQRVGERPVAEDVHVQQRVVDLELDHDEQREAEHGHREQDEDLVGRPAPVLALGQRQQQREQAGRDGEEAPHVEVPRADSGEAGQHHQRRDEADDADGHVDEEDQPPVDVLHEVAAQRGPDGRRDDDPEAVHAHRRPDLLSRDDPVQNGQRHHGQHAPRDRLDDPEHDHAVQVPGQPAQRGSGGETEQGDVVDPGGAEPVAGPGAHRDDDAQRQRVGRRHPLDLLGGRPEVALHRRDRDVDDADVEHRHEHARDQHDHRDAPAALRRRGRGGRCGRRGGTARRGGRGCGWCRRCGHTPVRPGRVDRGPGHCGAFHGGSCHSYQSGTVRAFR